MSQGSCRLSRHDWVVLEAARPILVGASSRDICRRGQVRPALSRGPALLGTPLLGDPSSRYGGLGLGLYIARSIVVAHGGTMTVDSELGVGSTFTVTLPCSGPEPSTEQPISN